MTVATSWLSFTLTRASAVQVVGFDIPRTRFMYGTGIISVIGTSFTFLNVTSQSIGIMMVSLPPLDAVHVSVWVKAAPMPA